MPGSEQVAWEMYAELGERDRQAVDAWRSLGNDLVTSLFNSDVLSRERPRKMPADDLADWSRRRLGTDADLIRQQTAEHEAAHAVVARALGVRVVEVVVSENGRDGHTKYEQAAREDTATIAAAADVWINECRAVVFPNGDQAGCRDDNRALVHSCGGDPWAMREARRRARLILAERGNEVLTLAQKLAKAGRLDFPDTPRVSGS